ncbi:hypothetical protein AMATHDRAFT_6919 [Amanita thiersii Skay4041]|uniref:Uncharacterized protein n=1 Tax=Amanita thiersii Skay4041 TaxID=703135 RepID=A0A2A9NG94_9AGAR|nr:hypothetical protein AMATHDRAFT_6919 [Amanita thiersii Skay4041]
MFSSTLTIFVLFASLVSVNAQFPGPPGGRFDGPPGPPGGRFDGPPGPFGRPFRRADFNGAAAVARAGLNIVARADGDSAGHASSA